MRLDLSQLKRDTVLELLRGWAPEGAPAQEMEGYIRDSAGRLCASARALAQLRHGARVLEIGANPYFLTVLMHIARPDLDWVCTNWHEGIVGKGPHEAHATHGDGHAIPVRWFQVNVERDPLPFSPESFDAVVYCEVLEHLVEDPARSLEHIYPVLKRSGELLLTTPNPARLINLWKLFRQGTIYDGVSGYGIYGRHNREYSRRELIELLEGTGYRVTKCVTVETTSDWSLRTLIARLGYGEHHLILATRTDSEPIRYRPAWLYRSFHDTSADVLTTDGVLRFLETR
jgi:SAM-dependent methyltransferase